MSDTKAIARAKQHLLGAPLTRVVVNICADYQNLRRLDVYGLMICPRRLSRSYG